jgi:tetratricopeptide (TPR) repeat protein
VSNITFIVLSFNFQIFKIYWGGLFLIITKFMRKLLFPLLLIGVLNGCQQSNHSEQTNVSSQEDEPTIQQLYDNAFSKSKTCFKEKEGCKEAISLFDAVIALDTNHHKAFYNRGVCKMTLTDFKGALDDFSIASKLNPDDADYYYNKGYVELQLNMITEACEDFKISFSKGATDAKAIIDQVCK